MSASTPTRPSPLSINRQSVQSSHSYGSSLLLRPKNTGTHHSPTTKTITIPQIPPPEHLYLPAILLLLLLLPPPPLQLQETETGNPSLLQSLFLIFRAILTAARHGLLMIRPNRWNCPLLLMTRVRRFLCRVLRIRGRNGSRLGFRCGSIRFFSSTFSFSLSLCVFLLAFFDTVCYVLRLIPIFIVDLVISDLLLCPLLFSFFFSFCLYSRLISSLLFMCRSSMSLIPN